MNSESALTQRFVKGKIEVVRSARPFRLYIGDALNQLQNLENDSVNCTVTSPPYFRRFDYGVDGQYGIEDRLEDYLKRQKQVAIELLRVTRWDGLLWWIIQDSYNGSGGPGGDYRHEDGTYKVPRLKGANEANYPKKSQLLVPERTRIDFREVGWIPIGRVIWNKQTKVRGAADRLSYSYEEIFLFSKRSQHYWSRDLPMGESVWNIRAGRQPYVVTKDYGGVRGVASFSLEVAERCIQYGSAPGHVILDPYVGMGTTIIAALGLDREAVGIELSCRYAAAALKRISDFRIERGLENGN